MVSESTDNFEVAALSLISWVGRTPLGGVSEAWSKAQRPGSSVGVECSFQPWLPPVPKQRIRNDRDTHIGFGFSGYGRGTLKLFGEVPVQLMLEECGVTKVVD